MDESIAYLKREGLDRYFSFYEDRSLADPFYATSGKARKAFAPKPDDLARLHRLVRQRMAVTVLEFGVGFSTLVLADAMAKNEAEFEAVKNRPKLRNTRPFHLFSVDASRRWIAATRKLIPGHLAARVHLSHSAIEAGTFNGRLCHFYKRLPNVVPDFIYLDAPAPKDVKGRIRGLDFSIDERTVMSGDILLMESTLLPKAFILVDGRTNNARFLERNFQRSFVAKHDPEGDVTTFELDEPPLGRHSHDLAALVRR